MNRHLLAISGFCWVTQSGRQFSPFSLFKSTKLIKRWHAVCVRICAFESNDSNDSSTYLKASICSNIDNLHFDFEAAAECWTSPVASSVIVERCYAGRSGLNTVWPVCSADKPVPLSAPTSRRATARCSPEAWTWACWLAAMQKVHLWGKEDEIRIQVGFEMWFRNFSSRQSGKSEE